jgi:hypothetical protein
VRAALVSPPVSLDIIAFLDAIDKIEEVEDEVDLAHSAANGECERDALARCLERTSTKLRRAREALDEIFEVAKLAIEADAFARAAGEQGEGAT